MSLVAVLDADWRGKELRAAAGLQARADGGTSGVKDTRMMPQPSFVGHLLGVTHGVAPIPPTPSFCNNSERWRLLCPLAEEKGRYRRPKHLAQRPWGHRRQHQDMTRPVLLQSSCTWPLGCVSQGWWQRSALKHSSSCKIWWQLGKGRMGEGCVKDTRVTWRSDLLLGNLGGWGDMKIEAVAHGGWIFCFACFVLRMNAEVRGGRH